MNQRLATPLICPAAQLVIRDLFAEAATDTDLATCINNLLATVERLAKARGLI